MKQLLAIAIILFGSFAFADETDDYNIRFRPVAMLPLMVGVDMDFKIDDKWALGPEIMYASVSEGSNGGFNSEQITTFGVGARANWYRNGAYTTGLYVGPSLTLMSIKVSASDSSGSYTGSAAPLLAGCVVGYAWFWHHFNLMLGGGGFFGVGNTEATVKDSEGNSFSQGANFADINLEVSTGWTF